MNRPKRVVIKPGRYMTTSSEDEGPRKKKRTTEATITSNMIQQDINDINRTLNEDLPNLDTHTQNTSHTHTNVQPLTYTVSHINTQPHTNTQYHANTFPCTEYAQEICTDTYNTDIAPNNILPERQTDNAYTFTLDNNNKKVYYTNSTLDVFHDNRTIQEDACHHQRGFNDTLYQCPINNFNQVERTPLRQKTMEEINNPSHQREQICQRKETTGNTENTERRENTQRGYVFILLKII